MTVIPPLDPFSEVVDERRRWTPDWYSWLQKLIDSIPTATPPSSGSDLGIVNVKDFGATGDGTTDDTLAIQAAIDHAFSIHAHMCYVPAGSYKITVPLWLDPPGNMRVSGLTNPTMFSFSMSLVGEEGLGNHETYGARLNTTFNDQIALIVGTGQGMMVKNISVIGGGPGVAYRGNQPGTGVGIGLCGGSAGSSRARIENCQVDNFYVGISTGANRDTLCDSNTFIKCNIVNAKIGFEVRQTQNFINTFIDCQPNFCTFGILNVNGPTAVIIGGNWSAVSCEAAKLAVTSISALTGTPFGNGFTWTFTAVIPSPDGNIPNIYNSFMFKTAHFGIVPCTMTSWNAGTKTGSFTIFQNWSSWNFGRQNVVTDTDFQAELQACTDIWCVERAVTFAGYNFSVTGVHMENPNAPCTWFDIVVGFGDNRPSSVRHVFWNTDPSFFEYRPSNLPPTGFDNLIAMYYCAQVFPFISVGDADLHISDCQLGGTTGSSDYVMIDFTATGRLRIDRCRKFTVNLRNPGGNAANWALNESNIYYALGEFDHPYTISTSFGTSDIWRLQGWGASDFWGIRPDPRETPVLTNSAIGVISGTLPAISGSQANYAILWGGQVYRRSDFFFATPPATYNLVSNHHFYTYGQDLTGLNWSYKGQSAALYVDDLRLFFPGLGIILDNGVDGNQLYMVTEVHPNLGYCLAIAGVNLNNGFVSLISPLVGTKTTVFTGTTVKQEALSITTF